MSASDLLRDVRALAERVGLLAEAVSSHDPQEDWGILEIELTGDESADPVVRWRDGPYGDLVMCSLDSEFVARVARDIDRKERR